MVQQKIIQVVDLVNIPIRMLNYIFIRYVRIVFTNGCIYARQLQTPC